MMIRAVLLALVLASPASIASEVEHFTASATGTLTIGADGSVLDVEIKGTGGESLGKQVEAGFEEHIRSWRFEPVTENGVAVKAVGHMRLSLVATHTKGEKDATFGIRHVWFVDPPKTVAGTAGARPGHSMPPPSYPKRAGSDGVGGQVMLAVKIGADGKVADVAAQSLELTGNVPAGEISRNRYGGPLVRAAERAAAGWRFEGIEEGTLILVPVRFHPYFDRAWVRTVAVPVDVPAWVLASRAARTAVKFDGGGQRLSTRIKLETELVDPIDPAAGG